MGEIRLTLRVGFGPDRALGPGKIVLLETIRDTGSISQAGRSLGMSYRRAWLLVDDMNRC
jgi:molybdate transport system regulatory protein